MTARTTDRIMPKSGSGDSIRLADGRTIGLRSVNRKYDCRYATDDERRYGCYLVCGDDGGEYVVSADVSGLRSRTFRPCSGWAR